MKGLVFFFFLLLTGKATVLGQNASDSLRKADRRKEVAKVETGIASYYNSKFQGKPTASGEPYDEHKMTAAHNRLRFGTRIKVTNLRNNKSVIVRVNDRLHYRNTRLVDLSKAAATKLGFIRKGLTKVKVEVLAK